MLSMQARGAFSAAQNRKSLMLKLARLTSLAAFFALLSLNSTAISADKSQPNVIIIVADDLGYGDLGFQGGKDVSTPNLNRLAQSGTRCTNGYVNCPVCSPTRAALVTGRYQQRFGHEFNPGQQQDEEARAKFGLPTTEVTIANQFKKAGYHTGQVGKWHLGFNTQFQPLQRGFDESFSFLGGAHPYFPPESGGKAGIFRNGEEIHEPEYLTDAFGREGASYIERNAKQPFFLLLTFNAVHAPLDAQKDKLEQFKEISDSKRRSYAAMLSSMDDAVGRVLNQLDKSAIAQNTLIFFISDNGGPTQANGSQNTPLNGVKATVWEGGIRVPFVVSWPGVIPANATYDQPVIAHDIFATASAAVGVGLPEGRVIDSVNLLPYLKGENTSAPHEALFWRFGEQQAVRKGNFKLLRLRDGNEHLFDLSKDVGEKIDLLAQYPDIAKQLRADYETWNAQLVEPLWKQGGGRQAGQQRRRQK